MHTLETNTSYNNIPSMQSYIKYSIIQVRKNQERVNIPNLYNSNTLSMSKGSIKYMKSNNAEYFGTSLIKNKIRKNLKSLKKRFKEIKPIEYTEKELKEIKKISAQFYHIPLGDNNE
ncbi:hypothetical protein [Marinitoga sp. 1155]|uniref:hypothetical protein n=1 Tax=Marinitoga sp. 1155 TaxID=1428448 RepID=UPI0006416CFB|nr:hypothetical protein [Marinitoga sp. 1155]AMS34000.1 hypothetical protein UF09_58 [Marinitoga camini virus 2]KLO24786.1 hypothetical protein X274_02185 [Marinitoga sp. 1155]